MEKKLMNTDEMVEIFLITKRTLQEWVKNNPDFPKPFKIGRRLLWTRSEVEAYIESKKQDK